MFARLSRTYGDRKILYFVFLKDSGGAGRDRHSPKNRC